MAHHAAGLVRLTKNAKLARDLKTDYTAAELPLTPGDVVSGELTLSGWLWASDAEGRQGWTPLDCLVTL